MADIIATITTIVGGVVTWTGQYLSMITATGNELLLLFVCIPIVGLGVGILSRLFRVN